VTGTIKEGDEMCVQGLHNGKLILVCRSVYSKEELLEIKSHAERGGARIIKTSKTCDSGRVKVLMELDLGKRQF
jgi:hypothetical protein